MRSFLLWLTLPLLMIGCGKQQESDRKKNDFNSLMGANTSVWKFVETHEDFQNVRFFKEIYEKNKHLQFLKQEELSIPKVIHFIWVGPNPFPQESVQNVYSWVENHPNWTIKFWTDRKRPLPHPKMKLQLISEFQFEHLRDYYNDSDNYAEKSDLLRYEILNQEGGLYVDHDVKCFKPFTPFHYNFDLYCGLEPPHQPVLSSSISANNNIIGSIPRHPILAKCIANVEARWADVASAYPGDDKDSIIYRVGHRSFASFDDAVKELGQKSELRDIIFPAAYFNRIDDRFALYAHHYYASTWFEDESKFERNVRRRLVSISRKNNQILLFNAVILTANLFLFGCLVFQFRHIRRFTKNNK
ncbi:MAG: hypothetical protein KDK56_04640 [Simkania sp.]|nr:hypothetical protein [Simkania sp.]MCP5490654.1 hypothetical protein [Chlamydiales bacterium]